MTAAVSNPGPGRTHKTTPTFTMDKDILIPGSDTNGLPTTLHPATIIVFTFVFNWSKRLE